MSKNILLIGGSHGIGFEIAKNLHENHTVYVASRTNEKLGNLDVNYISFDATSDSIDETELPDVLHGFVYCPGSINLKPFKMLTTDTFKEDMELNFFSMVSVLKGVITRLVEGSSMVFFSTVAVQTGMPFHSSVAAAKGAIEGFTKSMAAEYAPKIRVNCIAPSLVDTPLAGRLLSNDKKRELMAQRHPLKRFGKPDDIANLAVFLLGDESTWITGQIIGVDGGMSTLNIN
ncbi:SDR family NAD(P)-dependent oxidoreductase [Croceivirga thetidis]|uniref:SDR family oxidoreductase n=1 Tax=Croceivirga thetidis TaxID=2721623 RepID=A0ABX1GQ70_9FLAO|nr:SDR family oxidoreductase [Croceivirga thetidis]NKI32071.1 SDR family oxidoreductase [Croceivirga thetidis]